MWRGRPRPRIPNRLAAAGENETGTPPLGRRIDGGQRRNPSNVGTWLSLVEHSLGVRGVGSSNLPVPTNSCFQVPRKMRSGFRPRAPALLTSAKRLNLYTSNHPPCSPTQRF